MLSCSPGALSKIAPACALNGHQIYSKDRVLMSRMEGTWMYSNDDVALLGIKLQTSLSTRQRHKSFSLHEKCFDMGLDSISIG